MELNNETAAAAGREYAENDADWRTQRMPIDAFCEWEWEVLTQEAVEAAGDRYRGIMVAFMDAYRTTKSSHTGASDAHQGA
jgi:hypothetical protein